MRTLFLLFLLAGSLAACQGSQRQADDTDLADRPIQVVATTSMVADLVRAVGGDRVDVAGLMGPGVDPHLYKASAGDVARMAGADVVFYNGLHLEGKMTDVFEQMAGRGVPTVAVAETIAESRLIASPTYAGSFDPHVWFDVALWQEAARETARALAELDPAHAATYQANLDTYLAELDALDASVREQLAAVPEGQRVLITSHDAFGYFGAAYDFEVRGLQGLSTATEAGTADVQDLADFVAEQRIPAIFVETSVSPRGIEAVREAVRARGFDVQIGGTLYGDALGSPGTPEASYLGTVRANVDTIVRGLTGATAS